MKTINRSIQYSIISFLLLFFAIVKSFALNYSISFSGSGTSTTVGNVEVHNLTSGLITTVPAGNILNLSDSPNAVYSPNATNESINIYPNPIRGKATVSFISNNAGFTQINIVGIDGRKIIGLYDQMEVGENSFQISLPKGAYILKIDGIGYSYFAKVISQTSINNRPEISFIGNKNTKSTFPQKSKSAITTMFYNAGDQLLYKGTSGNYSTIISDIPTGSKTTNFEFVACQDGLGNYYSVVKIGTQTWMAENLNTTKYRTGETVLNITDNSTWKSVVIGAYCNNNNSVGNGMTYGKLYNWYAVTDGRSIAPTGWHVPSNYEWTKLTNYLGGESVAGGKLKETGTSHWISPNTGATNSSGFTGLPGGFRTYDGTFCDIGYPSGWWSSTAVDASNAWYKYLYFSTGIIFSYTNDKLTGYSVRCVQDTAVLATISTQQISSITATTATSGGNITSDGGAPIIARGVCWSKTSTPTISNSKTTDGTGSGTFTSNITGLTAETTYYLRAYATNVVGTVYGNEISFSTKLAIVTTSSVSNITSTSVATGGNVTAIGGAVVTERGVCWSTSSYPTISNNKTSDGTGFGSFTSSISGLTPNTTYYVKAYATNSVGTAYGNEVSFQTYAVMDVDGNGYHSVTIGTQTWLVENLKTTKFNDGTSISNDTNASTWASLTTPSYCWYNNSISNKDVYGALYNWHTINTGKLAPTGWHVPSDAEWTTLTTFLGGESEAGGKLKEAGTTHWINENIGASNITKFTALPGGYRSNDGIFSGMNSDGYWWSTTLLDESNAWYIDMSNNNNIVNKTNNKKARGLSVRCVKDTISIPTLTTTINSLSTTSVRGGGNVTSDGGAPISTRGICWNTTTNPTTSNSKISYTTSEIGNMESPIIGLLPNTTYYFRAYATNSVGTGYGNEVIFQTYDVMDVDGNGYHSVIIGNQVWMVENLKTTKYRDGSPIPNLISSSEWANPSGGAYCDNINGTDYGKLYNWFATVDSKNLAPKGWHVPSQLDWYSLSSYLGNPNYSAGKLKETGTEHWVAPNYGATNETGFTGIPGGYRDQSGSFSLGGRYAYWWSTTQYNYPSDAAWYCRIFTEDISFIVQYDCNKIMGLSVRCVKDISTLPTLSTNSIDSIKNTTAKSAVNINSDGGANITARGVCWSTTTSPTIINNKTLEGTGIGSFTSTLTGLTPNTTYYVRAYATNSVGTAYGNEVSFQTYDVMDADGNGYHSVTIGTQTWLVENLKTTKYNDGTSISNITDNTAWGALTTDAYCWYNNDIANKSIYGALYNWYALNTGGLAPIGWHLPSDAEWSKLIIDLGGVNVAPGKLKEQGIIHWLSPNSDATNESGFLGLPGGNRAGSGSYGSLYNYGFWWSSTEKTLSNAYYWRMHTDFDNITLPLDVPKNCGFSVRCIKNQAPILTTSPITSFTDISTSSGGVINSDGGASITAKGVCWSTSPTPTITNSKTSDGIGAGTFASSLIDLNPNTTYYVRAYATNSVGTAYGNEVSFQTYDVMDVDGNGYHSVTIGKQTWLVENLKTTKLRDSTLITNVTDATLWANLSTSAYCDYNNTPLNSSINGKLYNWFAVNTGKLAPKGWHIPTNSEWTTLIDSLGGASIAGGKLKETGTTHWTSPNTGATNETGFFALPSGGCDPSGKYYALGTNGNWWSSTEVNSISAWYRDMGNNYNNVNCYGYPKNYGLSIRCVKDVLPVITTNGVGASANQTTAMAGGNITYDGGAAIIERGVCWSKYPSHPTIESTHKSITIEGDGTGTFSYLISGLPPDTMYNLRAYAINSVGIVYGNEVGFKTKALY